MLDACINLPLLRRVFTSYDNKYKKIETYYFKVKNVKKEIPLITVAVILLKGLDDLISIMVALEVLV